MVDNALVGRRIRLIYTNDPYATLPVGALGTVRAVDDLGTVFVRWDNGSRLGLCAEYGDQFEEVE